jgi:uncharacterized protein YbjT (DUF2867 family)
MKILVAGATGTVGHHLVDQLHAMGHEVRALTRNAAKADFSAGVEVVQGDLTHPTSIAPALKGVTGLHLINFGGENFAPLETGAEIVALAEKAGIRRVTVLGNGQITTVESAVEASSMAWTMLRPVEFMSNILNWSSGIRTNGEVRQPFGDRKTAIVHEADIAAVAAGVLTSDGHGGKTYFITGPAVLTPRIIAHTISEVVGCDIQFVDLTPEQAREEWVAGGLPGQIADFLLWAYGNTPEAGYTVVPTVEQVSGRPARTFAQWAVENADAFRSEATI